MSDQFSSNLQTSSGFTFSGEQITNLQASEFTLASVVVDVSSSVSSFRNPIEDMLETIRESCLKSPRRGNLMLRVNSFNAYLTEIHGFRLLTSLKAGEYNGAIKPSGSTALYDAVLESLEASRAYADQLATNFMTANAVIYVITDGEENSSTTATVQKIKDTVNELRQKEILEGVQIVLIGLAAGSTSQYLDNFKNDAALDEYLEVGVATAGKLAKVAGFVSKSISSSSLALQQGQAIPAASITF